MRKSKKIGNKSFVIYILHTHTLYANFKWRKEDSLLLVVVVSFSRVMIWASYIFISLSLSLSLSRWLIWFKRRGGEWLQPYNCSLYFFIYIYMSPNTTTLVSITNDYVNRQSWVVIEKNTSMKNSFIFNKVYITSPLMSKRLKTKKKPEC